MKLCKTMAVIYYIFAACMAIASGVVILGWILSGAASAIFGDIGLLPISAAAVAALILIFGFAFIYVHSAMLLQAERREDILIYYLYQAASVCFMLIFICGGIVLNYIGILNIPLSIAFYGTIFLVHFLGAKALKMKRLGGKLPATDKKKSSLEEPVFQEESLEDEEEDLEENANLQHGIYVLKGEYAGNFFAMDPEEEVLLGTRPDICNIVFHDNKISRRHCKIKFSQADGLYYVIDYSTNGTFLMDGTRLPMGRAQGFKLGTKICFENQHHVFQLM
ncbi:MAG: FHA domain-containing protein [Eubacterium sp.]|nr:FHA domain-containing protein [Eubacterium sp.]